jgi:hypothetical protein
MIVAVGTIRAMPDLLRKNQHISRRQNWESIGHDKVGRTRGQPVDIGIIGIAVSDGIRHTVKLGVDVTPLDVPAEGELFRMEYISDRLPYLLRTEGA